MSVQKDLEEELELARRSGALCNEELAIKTAMVRALAEQQDDDAAYLGMLESIAAEVGAEAGIFTYIDASLLTRAIHLHGMAARPLSHEETKALAAAVNNGKGALALLDERLEFTIARSLVTKDGQEVGTLLVGKNGTNFPISATHIIEGLAGELASLVAAREARMRQELVQREAEKALRRSEERLRTFFEESHDMIYTANKEDVIASINAAGLALLGCKDRFEALGRPFSNFVLNKADRQHFLERIMATGYINDYEIVLQRPDGTTTFCIETGRAVLDGKGSLIEVQSIVKDISERIKNERELWQANMELADANLQLKKTQVLIVQQEKLASIGHLAAGIAHEINNPLGFLKSNQTVLARFSRSLREAWSEAIALFPEELGKIAADKDLDYIFTESEELLAESDEGYHRIMDIVKNLKTFAREGAETKIGDYDLNKGIESTLLVAANAIKYVAEVEKHLGELPMIEADGGGINQVLLNILVNAAEAIEAQGRKEKGKIVVSTSIEGEGVVCRISDDGPGIPEELRYRIFDPFFTTKEPGKGTGLGLSISYDLIVNKHGGSLNVESGPKGGAAFMIYLPRRHPSPPAPAKSEA
jgi:PAS domain S-box-containing protein